MNHKVKSSSIFTLVVCLWFSGTSSDLHSQEDKTHFSRVFNREKPYRIFFPEDYYTSQRSYPVIYYFHGNTGTHELKIEGIKDLINRNEIILVAWNGRSVDSDIRPYNIGNHSNIIYQIQFKDYFPELVNHIDASFRTIPGRSNRAVLGHSMGGIMAYFIAGKYPDLIGTAYSAKGSPEFFIGTSENHSLYHVRHMFKNLYGARLGFATSKECELFYLNNEVITGALRDPDLDFSYTTYEGDHSITPEQFRDAFNFIVSSFRNPLPLPGRWNHSDLYSDFKIWDYEVKRTPDVQGFIDLKGVTKSGFRIGTKKWEPDGGIIPGVQIDIKTPPNFRRNTSYTLLDYNENQDIKILSVVTSDSSGRINLSLNHENHQIGIYKNSDPPELAFVAYKIKDNGLFLNHKKTSAVCIRILNKGGCDARGIKVQLKTTTEGVKIDNPLIELRLLGSGELAWLPADFNITAENAPVTDGSPFRIRFNLTITDSKKNKWSDEFDAPVFYDVPEFTQIGIDDGDSGIFGSGNGNNTAEPGETIMIYEISSGSRRLRLYYDDPYIDSERLYDEIQPDKWGDGYTLSSLIHISEDCPPGHQIRFLANYEIKDWKKIKRDVTWGTFTITVGHP
jgi:enterochelin esterase-like enzyme